MPLLEFSHLEITYGGRPTLQDVSLSVEPGEILCIVGESGSGKTTLVRAAMGLLPPEARVTGGSIRYRETELTGCGADALRRLRGRELTMVFQSSAASLCPVRTVWAQLREAAGRGADASVLRQQAVALMERLQLEDAARVLSSYPFELSGGMAQRVGLLFAMLPRPRLLFADEPTSALDVTAQRQVLSELRGLRDRCGTAIVLVTHNIGVAEALADRVAVLQNGRLAEWGDAGQVLSAPRSACTARLIAAVPHLRRS